MAKEVISRFLLTDDVIFKLVSKLYVFAKENVGQKIIDNLKNDEVSEEQFDQMLMVDYFTTGDNLQKYIDTESKYIVGSADNLTDVINLKVKNFYNHFLDATINSLKSNIMNLRSPDKAVKNVYNDIANNFLQSELDGMRNECSSVIGQITMDTKRIPDKFLQDSISNCACSIEGLLMNAINSQSSCGQISKDDSMNIVTMLLNNGVIKEGGTFNPAMLTSPLSEAMAKSNQITKTTPFVLLSKVTNLIGGSNSTGDNRHGNNYNLNGPGRTQQQQGYNLQNDFQNLASGFSGIGSFFGSKKKDYRQAASNVSSIFNSANNIGNAIKSGGIGSALGGLGGLFGSGGGGNVIDQVKKIIAKITDIDFGKYEVFKKIIEGFCNNFYGTILEFAKKNKDLRKVMMKMVQLNIMTKLINVISDALQRYELGQIFSCKKDSIYRALEQLKNNDQY